MRLFLENLKAEIDTDTNLAAGTETETVWLAGFMWGNTKSRKLSHESLLDLRDFLSFLPNPLSSYWFRWAPPIPSLVETWSHMLGWLFSIWMLNAGKSSVVIPPLDKCAACSLYISSNSFTSSCSIRHALSPLKCVRFLWIVETITVKIMRLFYFHAVFMRSLCKFIQLKITI